MKNNVKRGVKNDVKRGVKNDVKNNVQGNSVKKNVNSSAQAGAATLIRLEEKLEFTDRLLADRAKGQG